MNVHILFVNGKKYFLKKHVQAWCYHLRMQIQYLSYVILIQTEFQN